MKKTIHPKIKRLDGESIVAYLTRVESIWMKEAKERIRVQWRKPNPVETGPFKARLLAKQDSRCYWCCKSLEGQWYHIDHIIPRSLGGSNHPMNLRVACPGCNLSKNDRHPNDFALSLFA